MLAIRRATPEDFEAVGKLIDSSYVPETEDSGLGDWIRTYARFGWPEDGKRLLVRVP